MKSKRFAVALTVTVAGTLLSFMCAATGTLAQEKKEEVKLASHVPEHTSNPFSKTLKKLKMKIAYESYVNGNWEIFTMNADGTNKVNLTHSPDRNEHFPQISPNGTKIAYSIDKGEGRDAVRSLWIMDIDGKNQKKIADGAREPFWSPDGKIIGFLPQEFPKFNVMDFYTNGMSFYHLDSGNVTPHPNTANIRHLYNPGWSKNGKWITATVHGGMGFGHAIILIEANGPRIIDLKIPGCRPRFSPDGTKIAWGAGDHELAIAPIDLDAETPKVGPWSMNILDEVNKIYHINWSNDSKYVAFSRGPDGEGDVTKKGSFQAACEIIGVYAGGWNIYAISAEHKGPIDLQKATDADFSQLTTNGDSNKQPAWFRAR
jgi:Tol biopolymer transport system component